MAIIMHLCPRKCLFLGYESERNSLYAQKVEIVVETYLILGMKRAEQGIVPKQREW